MGKNKKPPSSSSQGTAGVKTGLPQQSSTAVESSQKKRKKKITEPSADDLALQELVDFIEGNEANKENVDVVSETSKKTKKKKTKKVQQESQDLKESVISTDKKEVQDVVSKSAATKDKVVQQEPVKSSKKPEPQPTSSKEDKKEKKETQKAPLKEKDQNKSNPAKSKPKQKASKKKEPTKEELEIEQILKFIEGTSLEDADKNNNENENAEKKAKKKKNKTKKKKSKNDSESDSNGLDFNAMESNTVLTKPMLDYIVQNPPTVADFRIFNPKQVALLFSRGHNEHWNEYPNCKGRLKALEKTTEGFTLYDPGCKQLKLIVDELKRNIRGRPITKADMVQGLLCHAYLKCPDCEYVSDVVILNNHNI